jgi:hypothetical protein
MVYYELRYDVIIASLNSQLSTYLVHICERKIVSVYRLLQRVWNFKSNHQV